MPPTIGELTRELAASGEVFGAKRHEFLRRAVVDNAAKAARDAEDPEVVVEQVNGPNPKDLAGRCKPDLSLVSGTMLAHMADGLADGARKYGVGNWREIPVEARTYISAAERHLKAWLDREERASDSDVHHLGHALATIGIVLDALACGTLIDNRAKAGASSQTFLELTTKRKLRQLQRAPEPAQAGPTLPPELASQKRICITPGPCSRAQQCLGPENCRHR